MIKVSISTMRMPPILDLIKVPTSNRWLLVVALGFFSAFSTATEAAIVLIDNSGFTATASSTIGSSRTPAKAVDGSGLVFVGAPGTGDENDPTKYRSQGSSNGSNNNWLSANSSRTAGQLDARWFKLDLGQSYEVGILSFFNFNSNNGLNNRGVSLANIFYLDAASDPNANTDGNNTAFDSTIWTQLGNSPISFEETPGGSGSNQQPRQNRIKFGEVDARYIAFEILDNHGDDVHGSYVGIGELQLFTVPEPSSAFGAIGMACAALLRRRKRQL